MPLKKMDSKQIILKCESKVFIAIHTSKQEVKNILSSVLFQSSLQNAAHIYDEIQRVLEKKYKTGSLYTCAGLHVLAVPAWVKHLTSLSLRVIICKRGLRTPAFPFHRVAWEEQKCWKGLWR